MGKVTLRWTERNDDETGHVIYRSTSPMTLDALPEPIATLGANVEVFEDTSVLEDITYYYRVGAMRDGSTKVSDEIEVSTAFNLGPGGDQLLAGSTTAGFYGEVPVSELINGDDLASMIELTAGTSQHSSEPWLKFVLDKQIMFVAKKPYRRTVSWDDINAVNAVYGGRTIEIGGYTYQIRLLTGGDADPASGAGGEWNRLMYNVHVDVPVDQVGDNWASYTDADIVVGSGDGRISWVQEALASDASKRVARGFTGLSHFYSNSSSTAGSGYGWRPALVLVV